MDLSGIYCIKNISNNKVYVGSAVEVYKRWRTHKSSLNRNLHHSKHLQNAWNLDNSVFKFYILEEIKDKHCLIEREQFWMGHYKSFDQRTGYNICKVASSTLGLKLSEVHKNKISRSLIGRPKSKQHAKNIGLGHLGRQVSKETLEKMRQSRLGKRHTPETKRKIGLANSISMLGNKSRLGKPHTQETKDKIRLANMIPRTKYLCTRCGSIFYRLSSKNRNRDIKRKNRRIFCSSDCFRGYKRV